MPRSKKNKIVSLTNIKKKGKDLKAKLIEELHNAINSYRCIYVFSVENMKNDSLKRVRLQLRDSSRFFLGKNKVMSLALGRTNQDEFALNLHHLSSAISGSRGLLFSNLPPQEVKKFFDEFEEPHFPRAGFVATSTFALKAGELEEQPFSIEAQLRQLGLPTRLIEGKVMLETDTQICKEGDVLTPEQCRLLKIFGVEMAVFKVKVHCVWNNGTFTDFETNKTIKGDAGLQYLPQGKAAEEDLDEDFESGEQKGDDEDEDDSEMKDAKMPAQDKKKQPLAQDQKSQKKGDKKDKKEEQPKFKLVLEDGTEVVDLPEAEMKEIMKLHAEGKLPMAEQGAEAEAEESKAGAKKRAPSKKRPAAKKGGDDKKRAASTDKKKRAASADKGKKKRKGEDSEEAVMVKKFKKAVK